MAKDKIVYFCTQCGHESARWLGKCPACDNWNTFAEEKVIQSGNKNSRRSAPAAKPQLLEDITSDDAARYATGMQELDRVLGGGLVRGSAVLLGGDPGIGKSTLLLQISQTLSAKASVLYVTGEESAAQIKMRAQRLKLSSKNLFVLCESDLDAIEEQILALSPGVIVIDSIQTMHRQAFSSSAGSVLQVREATACLTQIAKQTGSAVFLVGHVTKQGAIAGPRVLEHLVDTVLYFEGDRQDAFRVLRTVKNRFGSTNEIGVFEMSDEGMLEVLNPSELFLSQRQEQVSGCAVLCAVEGTRPVLAEVQALCSSTSYGTARRTSTGIDYNRMVLLCAVLEKKLNFRLSDQDIFVNVVGGLRIEERCADLPVMAAIASSLLNRSIDAHAVAIGEVGLTGEVRAVNQIQKRAQECAKLGYKRLILPKKNVAVVQEKGIELIGVETVAQALGSLLKD